MKFKIDDDPGDAAFLVCTRADQPSPFAGNVTGVCSVCGEAVQHRPHTPPGLALICLPCYEKQKSDDDTFAVTTTTMRETAEWVKDQTKNPMSLCCIEAFALKGIMTNFALAKAGDQYTCPGCGRVYACVLRRGEKLPVWTLVGSTG